MTQPRSRLTGDAVASTSCPLCGAWTVGFTFDLKTGVITWYCLVCGHRWRRPEDDRPVNVPKFVLYGAGMAVGLLGLGVLVTAAIIEGCIKRSGWT